MIYNERVLALVKHFHGFLNEVHFFVTVKSVKSLSIFLGA